MPYAYTAAAYLLSHSLSGILDQRRALEQAKRLEPKVHCASACCHFSRVRTRIAFRKKKGITSQAWGQDQTRENLCCQTPQIQIPQDSAWNSFIFLSPSNMRGMLHWNGSPQRKNVFHEEIIWWILLSTWFFSKIGMTTISWVGLTGTECGESVSALLSLVYFFCQKGLSRRLLTVTADFRKSSLAKSERGSSPIYRVLQCFERLL